MTSSRWGSDGNSFLIPLRNRHLLLLEEAEKSDVLEKSEIQVLGVCSNSALTIGKIETTRRRFFCKKNIGFILRRDDTRFDDAAGDAWCVENGKEKYLCAEYRKGSKKW